MSRRTTRIAAAVIALAALAACSSIPIGTASKLRGLDYLNDDVASLLLALDLPPSLEPMQGASTIGFDITTPANGERRIKATLIAADADELAGTLPPPPPPAGTGRPRPGPRPAAGHRAGRPFRRGQDTAGRSGLPLGIAVAKALPHRAARSGQDHRLRPCGTARRPRPCPAAEQSAAVERARQRSDQGCPALRRPLRLERPAQTRGKSSPGCDRSGRGSAVHRPSPA